MERPLPIEPEELLSHARWMRALARSLVGDAASADDVVQESMAAALRRPPDSGRPLRAWLSRVVRNVASNLRRGEQRLAERHARGAVAEEALDPAATIERLDTQGLIVELVRELEEPARSTIVLRYFEGLDSPEIGRRMGVSDATVRWRIQKALGELRTRLERKFGSRDGWCAALLPLARSFETTTVTAAGAAATAGALTMGAMSKLAVAAAALSIVGTGLWFALERGEPDPRAAEVAAPPALELKEDLAPIAPTAVEREALAPEKTAVAASEKAAPAPEIEAADASPSSGRVRAKFVDSTGQPWERVWFRGADKGEPSTYSGSDGRAELWIDLADDRRDSIVQFAATRSGCATRTMRVTLSSGGVVDLGEVVLDREARVKGFVRDTHGAGLGDVTVGLSPVEHGEPDSADLRRHGSIAFDRLIVARSDARGAFDLHGIPAGSWRLWGKRADLGYGVSEPFELQIGEQKLGLEFEVPALQLTDSIRGVVLDPAGNPVAGARIMVNYESEHESGTAGETCRADGSFEFLVYMEVPMDIVATDEQDRWAEAVQRGVPPGARDIVLQLSDRSAQPHARIRVHGPANEPVREIEVSSRAGKPNSYSVNTVAVSEIEPGLYDYQAPVASFGLTVAAKGYLESALIPFDPSSVPAQLEVALELAPVLRGRVHAGGKPIEAALVEARAETSYTLTFNGFPCLMSTSTDASASSGAEGEFTLLLQGKDPVYLRCTASGYAPSIVGPIRLDPAAGPVEIELGPGGAIEGRVRSKDGTPLVGAIVGITCGDAHPRTMRSGHDGVFRFEGLSVGSWLVMERDVEFRRDVTTTTSTDTPRKIEWSCEVVAGRTTFHDLKLDH